MLQHKSIVEKMSLAGKKNPSDNLHFWLSEHCVIGHRTIIVTNTQSQSQLIVKKLGEKTLAIALVCNF